MAIKIVRTLEKLSLGFVLVLAFLWFYIQFPQLRDITLVYILITAFVFSFGQWKVERALFRAKFLKKIPVLIIAFIIASVILFIFGLIIKKGNLPTIRDAVAGIGLGYVALHLFIVSTSETFIFQGWVPDRLKQQGFRRKAIYIISATIFALFHVGMAGWSWILILPYIPLGMLFLWTRYKFSPKTLMAVVGCHLAYNLFILGFMI